MLSQVLECALGLGQGVDWETLRSPRGLLLGGAGVLSFPLQFRLQLLLLPGHAIQPLPETPGGVETPGGERPASVPLQGAVSQLLPARRAAV